MICSAQNDANFRKEKTQSLKGREGKPQNVNRRSSTPNVVSASPNSRLQVERLLKEIVTLKETNNNKRLASQVQVNHIYFFIIKYVFIGDSRPEFHTLIPSTQQNSQKLGNKMQMQCSPFEGPSVHFSNAKLIEFELELIWLVGSNTDKCLLGVISLRLY